MNRIGIKYITFLVGLLILIFISACHFLYGETKARLAIEEPVYNFGTVKGDTILTHEFSLANVGTDTLYIKGVRST